MASNIPLGADSQNHQQIEMVAQTLQRAAETLSLDQSVMKEVCIKVMIVSLKYVHKETVWESLFPGHFVDWELLSASSSNILGDLNTWIPLLELCRWEKGTHYAEHAPLSALSKAIVKNGLDDGEVRVDGNWTLPCQLLLIQLLQGIPTMQAFEILTCRRLKRNTHQNCALLLASMSDAMYAPEAYAQALRLVLDLKTLRIDTENLEAHAKVWKARREDVSKALTTRIHMSNIGRPRLRDRLTISAEENTKLDTLHGTWESYTSFCQLHQFPNVLSETIKMKVYFMAAQKTWDWAASVPLVIHNSASLCERVGQYPVSKPDPLILHRCVNALSMTGSPPFPEMIQFKATCFRSFPVSHVHRITLSQVLRLYVCAYQNPAIWKELWKMQVQLLSPQIIKDCEAFVKEHPFASAAFMRLFHPESVQILKATAKAAPAMMEPPPAVMEVPPAVMEVPPAPAAMEVPPAPAMVEDVEPLEMEPAPVTPTAMHDF